MGEKQKLAGQTSILRRLAQLTAGLLHLLKEPIHLTSISCGPLFLLKHFFATVLMAISTAFPHSAGHSFLIFSLLQQGTVCWSSSENCAEGHGYGQTPQSFSVHVRLNTSKLSKTENLGSGKNSVRLLEYPTPAKLLLLGFAFRMSQATQGFRNGLAPSWQPSHAFGFLGTEKHSRGSKGRLQIRIKLKCFSTNCTEAPGKNQCKRGW